MCFRLRKSKIMLLKSRNIVLPSMLFWFLAATNCGAQSTVNQSTQTIAENKELIPVTVYQLVVDPTSRQPVVTLADAGEQRALFIWIGLAEARAIYSELEGVEPQLRLA